MIRRISVLSILLTGCSLSVDYAGTSYLCSDQAGCPDGMRCVAEVCTPVDAPADVDAGPSSKGDASPLPDASRADAGGPTNLVSDPSFEAGLDEWNGYLGTLSQTSSNPHTGLHALRVCKDDTGHPSFFSAYRDLIVDDPWSVPAGAHYLATMWIRTARNPGDLPPSFVAPSLRERGGSQPFLDHHGPELAPVTSSWTMVSTDAFISDGDRTGLSIVLETGSEDDGTCFLVDDVYVFRID